DLFGRCELRRDDDVALVLAVLGVHQDVGAAVAGVLDDLLDGRDGAGEGVVLRRTTAADRGQIGSFHAPALIFANSMTCSATVAICQASRASQNSPAASNRPLAPSAAPNGVGQPRMACMI